LSVFGIISVYVGVSMSFLYRHVIFTLFITLQARKPSISFCQSCGSPTQQVVPDGEERTRAVCTICGKIHYENPKMVQSLGEFKSFILICFQVLLFIFHDSSSLTNLLQSFLLQLYFLVLTFDFF